jgi:hypothetical protein
MHLTLDHLGICADKLRVYDVDQNGWEQEPNGTAPNFAHTDSHLGKSAPHKDFYARTVVRNEIAPDSTQYAIRLMRWMALDLGALGMRSQLDDEIDAAARRMRITNLPFAAVLLANGELCAFRHDLEHEREREVALSSIGKFGLRAAGFLVRSAEMQAETFGFDLVKAFDERLVNLRKRFGIPEPPPDN